MCFDYTRIFDKDNLVITVFWIANLSPFKCCFSYSNWINSNTYFAISDFGGPCLQIGQSEIFIFAAFQVILEFDWIINYQMNGEQFTKKVLIKKYSIEYSQMRGSRHIYVDLFSMKVIELSKNSQIQIKSINALWEFFHMDFFQWNFQIFLFDYCKQMTMTTDYYIVRN